jgi:cyclic pyranopterin phosphate synthase
MTRQRPIHGKPVVYRRAVAIGELRVAPATLRAIRSGKVEKGDPLRVAEVAGLVALKRTPELIPHCHPVPVSGSSVELAVVGARVRARVEVEALYRTGVEMEALVGVTVALLTVWDMVKYLEKDARGGYPTTRIEAVRVLAKEKRPLRGAVA